MEDTKSGSGAPGSNAGGAGAPPDSGNPPSNQNSNPRTVSWEEHQRALADMHRFKRERADLETKLGDAESKTLREKEDFKGLYEREKVERERLAEENKKLTRFTVNTHRFNEVLREAKKEGLKNERDLELVDLEDVDVEATSSGRFLVKNASDKVQRLKSERPHWFGTTPAPTVNGGGGGSPSNANPGGEKKLTANDVAEAGRKAKRGQISKDEYHRIYRAYAQQNPLSLKPGNPNTR